MMIYIPSKERGLTKLPWLKSFHSFSFGDYFNPDMIHFKYLRVINEDIISPLGGFPLHSHENMEILTYMVQGELEHRDSLNNRSIISEGEIQKMTAGLGITHSERNPHPEKENHFYQIWILPRSKNLPPEYQQKKLDKENQEGVFQLMASPKTVEKNAVFINQNVNLYRALSQENNRDIFSTQVENSLWLQMIEGKIKVNSQYELTAGDALAISGIDSLEIHTMESAQFLLFEQF